ncbi:MAG TPA: hypothetical protein VKE74_20445, partial [Gemmataceae bacterium]|nr:hypothetical protein [Gemmataceae bacterium]
PPPPIAAVATPGFAGGVLPNNPLAGYPSQPPDPPPVVPAQRGDPDDPFPLGAKKGEFIVISPKKDTGPTAVANPPIPNGTVSPMVDRVAAAPPPLPRPLVGPEPGSVMKVEADPDREFARLVRLGREAFAAEEYGRAVGLFDQAAKVKPADPLPQFLKAQSQVAAGHYAEAVAAVREGMKLAPDWPASGFRPRDLYGTTPDRFDVHITALRKALAENPGDPTLQFLLGYELWFGGNRAEATELFRAADRGAKGNPLIGRFLKEAGEK